MIAELLLKVQKVLWLKATREALVSSLLRESSGQHQDRSRAGKPTFRAAPKTWSKLEKSKAHIGLSQKEGPPPRQQNSRASWCPFKAKGQPQKHMTKSGCFYFAIG